MIIVFFFFDGAKATSFPGLFPQKMGEKPWGRGWAGGRVWGIGFV